MYFERAHAKSQILCISKINVSLLRQLTQVEASWMYSTFNDCDLQIDLVQVLIILFINLHVVTISLLQGVNRILLYSTVVIKGHTCMSVTLEIS